MIESEQSPLESYHIFNSSLAASNVSQSVSLLSKRNRGELKQNYSYENFKSTFPVLATAHKILSVQSHEYQIIEDEVACITINGLDSGGEPTSINVELLDEDQVWVVDYLQVLYLEKETEYPQAAICPNRM